MVVGKYVTISGKILINKMATPISKKNGRAAFATYKIFFPVRACITKRLKPTGGVICDISTTNTMKIPNHNRSIFAACTIGNMTATVSTTTEIPSKKQPNITNNTVRYQINSIGDKYIPEIHKAKALGIPKKPIASVKKCAPTRMKPIIQELFTAPNKLSIKL